MSKLGDEFGDIKDDVKGKNGKDKRNTVIAIGTIVLVIIAYLTLKRMGQPSSGSGVTGSPTSGVTGDPGSPVDQSLAGVSNAINSQTGILDALDRQLRKLTRREGRQTHKINHLEDQLHKLDKKHPGKGGQGHPHKKSAKATGNKEGTFKHIKVTQGPNPPRKGGSSTQTHGRKYGAQSTARPGNWAGVGRHL